MQDALAKAFYALSLAAEVPPLRAWLFRIAHNAALDHLKSHGRKYTDSIGDCQGAEGYEDKPDPAVVRAALARFLSLPLRQRSAVILKDVLGHSLQETAETMGATVLAVKAALVRGRAALLAERPEEAKVESDLRDALDRYAGLFNRRDWDGVRALIGDDCRLDLVSRSQRRGKQVGVYFERYRDLEVSLRPVRLDGRLVLAASFAGAAAPTYFIVLEWEAGRVQLIRDFRYVDYIAAEAAFEPLGDP